MTRGEELDVLAEGLRNLLREELINHPVLHNKRIEMLCKQILVIINEYTTLEASK